MALTLDNEAGSTSANAYVSLATAGLYIEENIHITATWASLSTSSRTACIIYATSLLDTQIDWVGVKGDSTQALDWPRDDVYDPSGYAITNTDIPVFLQRACSFYAYFLSQTNRIAEDDSIGFKRLDAGSLRMDIDKYDRRQTMPTAVFDLLKYYGNKAVSRTRVLERI